ncbi:putative DeoR family transcriptional regulator [Gordonia effusa NBRC 100432]|uniref:Putative DeoR family transcriptional regulator n=1 Tax=Gordonia effusa NBRC 100432 TaxID=1077974 RepID=H0R0F2_9ACTN|nr:YafY family protein [Gordonia effusa]GAB18553.1 putative DeoR family transcriptional regulator [Gordonia effusa NBRC 100432]
MRTDRLLSLVALLRLRGRMTAAQLAEELEVSERTVMRDIDSLSVSGIPVYAERGRNGGFGLLPGFRADLSTLSIDEATALLAGGGRLAPTEFASAMRKIAVALPERQREQAFLAAQRILISPEGYLGESTPMSVLRPIQEAVLAGRRLALIYRTFDGEPKPRTLDPIGLIAADSAWYLVANSQGQQRVFRVSRCSGVTVLDEPAERSDVVDLAAIWNESRRSFRAQFEFLDIVVDVDDRARTALGHMARIRDSEPAGDGITRIVVEFSDRRHATNVLWRFGDAVRVIEPRDIRDEIVRRARAVAGRYESVT